MPFTPFSKDTKDQKTLPMDRRGGKVPPVKKSPRKAAPMQKSLMRGGR